MNPPVKVGMWVFYRLDVDDARRINGAPVSKRNTASAGDVFPALVVRVYGPELANLQVFPDANRPLWVTSRYLDATGFAKRTFAFTEDAGSPSPFATQPA